VPLSAGVPRRGDADPSLATRLARAQALLRPVVSVVPLVFVVIKVVADPFVVVVTAGTSRLT
jgi:hypothetical protein